MNSQTIIIVLSVIQFLLVIVQAMAWFIITGMMKRIEKAEENILDMKDNYIARFERVITNQNEARIALLKEQVLVKEQLIEAQHKVKDELIDSMGNLKVFIVEHINK